MGKIYKKVGKVWVMTWLQKRDAAAAGTTDFEVK